MIHLEVLAGLPKNKNTPVSDKTKKWKFNRKILHFSYSLGDFFAGELTMEWLLFFLENKENFIFTYLLEYNKKIPAMSEAELWIFFEILFADFNDKKWKQVNNEQNTEKIQSDVMLSIGMAVRHIRLSYGDIMEMRVGDFYEMLGNIEYITGTKSLEDRPTMGGDSDFVDSRALMELKNLSF